MLKDFTGGKLLYCKLPPDYDPKTEETIWQSNEFFKEIHLENIHLKEEQIKEE